MSEQQQEYELDLRTLLLAIGVAIICVMFVAAGITWPRMAGTLLRLLIITLAVMVVGGRAWHALAHVTARPKSYTPFDGVVADRERPAAPQALRRLAATFKVADDPEVAARAMIPWSTRHTLMSEVTRRLAERHGLDVDDRSHHARIRALVSEPTQRLIIPEPGAAQSSLQLSMSQLADILADVEKL